MNFASRGPLLPPSPPRRQALSFFFPWTTFTWRCLLSVWGGRERPDSLSEPRGDVSKVRRDGGCYEDLVPAVLILDTPLPQMGDHLVDEAKFLGIRLLVVAEQVIEVPKVSFHLSRSRRAQSSSSRRRWNSWRKLRRPLSDTVQQRTVEQIVDISRTGAKTKGDTVVEKGRRSVLAPCVAERRRCCASQQYRLKVARRCGLFSRTLCPEARSARVTSEDPQATSSWTPEPMSSGILRLERFRISPTPSGKAVCGTGRLSSSIFFFMVDIYGRVLGGLAFTWVLPGCHHCCCGLGYWMPTLGRDLCSSLRETGNSASWCGLTAV